MTDISGLSAPFLLSWLPFWVFCAFGGFASAFIVIGDIDNRLKYPFISKPLIGMMSGVAMVLYLNQNAEPPPSTLLFWGFVTSLLSTPIITGFLVFVSDQKRQDELYKSAQDKFVPWLKSDKSDKEG